MKSISQKTNVYELTEALPESISILKEMGFAPIANPVMRKTVGRKINLAQAAKIKKMDPAEFVKELAERLNVQFDPELPDTGETEVSMEDVFKAELGFVPPGIMIAGKLDSDFGDIISNYHHRIWGEEKTIPFKFKYLMALSAAIAEGDIDRAKLETRKAVLYGATMEQIKETIEMMVWLCGAPTLRGSVMPIISTAEKALAKQEEEN